MEFGHKPRILIVDDDRNNLDVLVHILKPSYDLFIAKSGEAALRRAQEDMPDLILLDIIMPDMNGFDVLKRLKTNEATQHVPVMFLTGLANTEDEERGFLLGAVDYIVKPFKNSIVLARVGTHIKILRQIRTIERLCLVDPLTNIPNRRNFDKRLEAEWGRAMREKSSLSVLIIDIDKFKRYNDTYGHPQGDKLLQSMGSVLSSVLKRPTDFVARLGGEEFAVLLPSTDLHGALAIAEEIRSAIASMQVPAQNNQSTSVTVSIGVAAAIPTPQTYPSDVVSQADMVLYTAKQSGRNQVCS